MPDLAVWPTDGADGSVSSEARWRKMARMWVPNGVDVAPLGLGAGTNALKPTLAAGPTINVAAGGAWLDGHYAELTTPAAVPASANGLLVCRLTPLDNRVELLYRDGAGLNPTQTLATWELPIARQVAGAMTDLRVWANALQPNNSQVVPQVVWDYTALKAANPVPAEGQMVTTAVDGRVWVFRSQASTPNAAVGLLPANRWETQVQMLMTGAATDAGGVGSIPCSAFGLDGYIAVYGHAGWAATAFPQIFVASVRWSSQATMQIRIHTVSAASAGTVAVLANGSNLTLYFDVLGYRV